MIGFDVLTVGSVCGMRELNVKDLSTFPEVALTGELGIVWVGTRWERDGQQLLGPLSHRILREQPDTSHWIQAACLVTGWTPLRVFAFQVSLSRINLFVGKRDEAKKGCIDANLYGLLYKLARKTDRGGRSL
jgi:hypothetical protein